jgi:hypothetical protein
VDGEDGALVVVRAGELELQLQARQLLLQAGEEALDLVLSLGGLALGDQLAPGGQLLGVGAQALERVEPPLEAAALLQDGSALRGIVPEARVLDLVVDLGEAPL